MSLLTNLQTLITDIGTQFKALRTQISGTATGDVSGLSTTATNLVGAINELNTASLVIDDVTASLTKVYSSTKTDAQVAAAVAALVNSAPGALDQLNELAAALGNDANYAATVATALALKANIADTYSVTQLGAALDTHDFAADFAAAIA